MADPRYVQVDESGNLILPPELRERWGLVPGSQLPLETGDAFLKIRQPITVLNRIYVEVTNQCTLNCTTCIRNVWDAAAGRMSLETFDRVLSGAQSFTPQPEIFLGGFGEPLSNPDCLTMIERAKSLGLHVSLITNGILLTGDVSQRLIDLALDRLWVSLDGASPECYTDVRLGAEYPKVIQNLEHLRTLRFRRFGTSPWAGAPKLGIAFVAMKRNIHELTRVIKMGILLGAVEFSISNVLAHTQELWEGNLYGRSLNQVTSRYAQQWKPHIYLPRLDVNDFTAGVLIDILRSTSQLHLFGGDLNKNVDVCPFIERGSLSIRWDGKVSPCLPLLYTHQHQLDDRERRSQAYFVGDLWERSLGELWRDPGYLNLREKLQVFDFSPCTYCNSCEMANDNLEDCYGNLHPACGGCLWSQGLIHCP